MITIKNSIAPVLNKSQNMSLKYLSAFSSPDKSDNAMSQNFSRMSKLSPHSQSHQDLANVHSRSNVLSLSKKYTYDDPGSVLLKIRPNWSRLSSRPMSSNKNNKDGASAANEDLDLSNNMSFKTPSLFL